MAGFSDLMRFTALIQRLTLSYGHNLAQYLHARTILSITYPLSFSFSVFRANCSLRVDTLFTVAY